MVADECTYGILLLESGPLASVREFPEVVLIGRGLTLWIGRFEVWAGFFRLVETCPVPVFLGGFPGSNFKLIHSIRLICDFSWSSLEFVGYNGLGGWFDLAKKKKKKKYSTSQPLSSFSTILRSPTLEHLWTLGLYLTELMHCTGIENLPKPTQGSSVVTVHCQPEHTQAVGSE